MTTLLKASAAALGLAVLAAAGTVPASAGPIPSQTALSKSGVAESLTAVREVRTNHRRAHRHMNGPRGYGTDTVGSVGQDGYGYGYNRFSGQRYQSCVEDLGYGRVRPCDAGRS